MRKGIVIALAIVVAGALAVAWLKPGKPHPGPWRLADGSELSLASVTRGKEHTIHYGNPVAKYFYRVLSPALRRRLGAKEITFRTTNTNEMMLWFWDKRIPLPPGSPGTAAYAITVLDDNGLPYDELSGPTASTFWRGSNTLCGWELKRLPYYSTQVTIRVYGRYGKVAKDICGEFKLDNPAWNPTLARRLPEPVKVETNGLEISLTRFETRVKALTRSSEGIQASTATSRALFTIQRSNQPAHDWTIDQAWAFPISGMGVPVLGTNKGGGEWPIVVEFNSLILPAENARPLQIELVHNLEKATWTIKGLAIPQDGAAAPLGLKTNLLGLDLELIQIKGKSRTARPSLQFALPYLVNGLRVSSPDVRDDQERAVQVTDRRWLPLRGARSDGETPQVGYEYFLKLPAGAKSLDVSLSYEEFLSVELRSRPVIVKEGEAN